MIKRNNIEVMNTRNKNVSLSKETLAILKQQFYTSTNGNVIDISNILNVAVNGTILYQYNLPNKKYNFIQSSTEITNETTSQAAKRFVSSGKDIVILNFASARNPGGGFLSGAIAQEEDLCRCSGLYACIKSKPIFYNENILCDNTFYTDNIIYSPKVPFFRDENLLLLEEPFLVSVITAPAPNIRAMENIDEKVLSTVIYNRVIKILKIAEAHGHKNIILGAFGCGAFGNDPKMVATIFSKALKVVSTFENVCFAIPVSDYNSNNMVFNDVLKK